MAGITKIQKISSAGIFSNFSWPTASPELSFKKINLLYGYNGSGKTTLSNVISLFSEDRDEADTQRIAQGLSSNPEKKLEVEIEWDGKTVKFPTDKKKLYVFNSAFIADHVYDGSQANVKSFKSGIVTQEQLSNPALKRINDKITEETTRYDYINSYKKKLETLSSGIKIALSKTWNDNIVGHNLPQRLNLENCPAEAPQESEEDLQQALEEEFLKFKVSKDQTTLEKDISDLKQIILSTLALPEGLHLTIEKSISKTTREKVQKKIDDFKAHALRHTTIQNWFDDGAMLLKQSKNNRKCPLCNSTLPNIEDIIASYDSFFNDELAALTAELNTVIHSINIAISEAEKWQSQVVVVQTILARYGFQENLSQEEQESFQRISSQSIKRPLNQVMELFTGKLNNIDFIPSPKQISDISSLLEAFEQFKADIRSLVLVRDRVLEKLLDSRFDAKTAREICAKLFWKRFDIQGKATAKECYDEKKLTMAANLGGIQFFHFLNVFLISTLAEIKKATTERDEERKKLEIESQYVNNFLAYLCVSNFTIKTAPDGEITVLYSGMPPKKGIRYSLSEGEKTALAFAYFLSKYNYEVIDNDKAKQEDFTIVVDDPVSSLDENRLFSTAIVIRNILLPIPTTEVKKAGTSKVKTTNWSGCKQILILSHNLVFLKFLASLINEDQNSHRADIYLEKGNIIALPNSLLNYQTSYFYKLGKIQEFANGAIAYDTVKDSLPNFIRITLETFIAFKFARLNDGDKKLPPMLNSLIKHLDQYGFKGFKAVDNISDKATLKTALQEIQIKVNSESHGTVQDITHIEYLPESELKKLAHQTLNVISFLDQIHFEAAQATK